ncbi:hypothetical protein [Actinacidiphila sp. bgisy160]|uniref:hypothetical protein n=1 Tax=Actinacidiphila sp. bgisy160 TaxID=3413796 RepID=UPI003D7033E7
MPRTVTDPAADMELLRATLAPVWRMAVILRHYDLTMDELNEAAAIMPTALQEATAITNRPHLAHLPVTGWVRDRIIGAEKHSTPTVFGLLRLGLEARAAAAGPDATPGDVYALHTLAYEVRDYGLHPVFFGLDQDTPRTAATLRRFRHRATRQGLTPQF